MKVRAKAWRLACITLVLNFGTSAMSRGASEVPRAGFSVYFENDMFRSSDHNYTMGLGFQWSKKSWDHSCPSAVLRLWDVVATRAGRWLGVNWGFPGTAEVEYQTLDYSYLLSGTAFTPDSLSADYIVREDRPYGFLFAFTTRRVSVSDALDASWQSEAVVGVLGTPVGREVQRGLHSILRKMRNSEKPPDPRGWQYQISNGGEPTLRCALEHERRLVGVRATTMKKHFEATGSAGAELGYYTGLVVGTRARLGAFHSNFWEFSNSPLGGLSRDASGRPTWEWFVFGGARGRAIAYNALLEGQFRKNEYEVDRGDLRHFLLEGEVGVSLLGRIGEERRHGLRVTWVAEAFRTQEFQGQHAVFHDWGSLFITVY